MKAHVTKQNESQVLTNTLLLATALLLATLVLLSSLLFIDSGKYLQNEQTSENIIKSSLLPEFGKLRSSFVTDITSEPKISSEKRFKMQPMHPLPFTKFYTETCNGIEEDKLVMEVTKRTLEMKQFEKTISNNSKANLENIMANFEMYMEPELEEEANLDEVMTELSNLAAPKQLKNVSSIGSSFNPNYALLELYKEKQKEVAVYCEYEYLFKMFASTDKEKPLELEDWMNNEECWCPEFKETFAALPEK